MCVFANRVALSVLKFCERKDQVLAQASLSQCQVRAAVPLRGLLRFACMRDPHSVLAPARARRLRHFPTALHTLRAKPLHPPLILQLALVPRSELPVAEP